MIYSDHMMENTETENTPTEQKPVKKLSPILHWLKREHGEIEFSSLENVLTLLEQKIDPTIIYFKHRDKSKTVSLNSIFSVKKSLNHWKDIERRRDHLIREIKAQDKLSPELENKIKHTNRLNILDDIFLPFKLKKTLASQAKEAGLEPFATWLWENAHSEQKLSKEEIDQKAQEFAKSESSYSNSEEVIKGAQTILTENIAEEYTLRNEVRQSVMRNSKLCSQKGPKAKPKSKYSRFFEYREPIGSIRKENSAYRYLTIRKGWLENELILSFDRSNEGILAEKFEKFACTNLESASAEIVLKAARTALKTNVYTVMENEAHKELRNNAEKIVVQDICKNLKKRLNRAPLGRKTVLGIDSGTGGKNAQMAIVDAQGNVLVHQSFSLKNETEWEALKTQLDQTVKDVNLDAITIGQSSVGKRIRELLIELKKQHSKDTPILMVYEQSAAAYSISKIAKQELSKYDTGVRRAVFIARLVQDPVYQYAKVESKALANSPFQYELSAKYLDEQIRNTIQEFICSTGLDVNQASQELFEYIPGIPTNLCHEIVQHRKTKGKFEKLEDLFLVPGFTKEIFALCSSFLKITNAKSAVDASILSQEDFELTENIIRTAKLDIDINSDPRKLTFADVEQIRTNEALHKEFDQYRIESLADKLTTLCADFRTEFKTVQFNPELRKEEGEKEDLLCTGIVTNITNFGAFVDVGISQDGLVHISEFSTGFVKNPHEVFVIGEEISVYVRSIDKEKNQISLSLKSKAEREEMEKARKAKANARKSPKDRKQVARNPRRGPKREAKGDGATSSDKKRSAKDRKPREKKEKKEEKKRPPKRDPKTGAVVKMDDDVYSSQRGKGKPRFSAKAKTTTFNPFANLNQLVKSSDSSNDKDSK